MRYPPVIADSMLFYRWARRVLIGDGCWNWTGSQQNGYGYINADGRARLAHRIGYRLLVGVIPEDLPLDHLCRNHSCVRPDHLEPVTHAVNNARGFGPSALNTRKTGCPKGHEYDRSYRGRRHCSVCDKAASLRFMAARRAE